MISREELESVLDEVLAREVEIFVETVPYATHLTDLSQTLNEKYYIRHRIETIKRIRMTSRTDALALAKMVEEDYDTARVWAKYTVQELNHDLLFLRDLKQHGYTEEMVYDVEPLPSTKAMVAYIADQIERVGSIAAVAYSVFVEWNSERFSATVVEKAAASYSDNHTKGAKTHVGIDDQLDHYGMMLDVAYPLLARYGSEKILIELVQNISGYLRQYFAELYQVSVNQESMKSSVNA